jgi:two-component system, LytTR family, response regulator LytT
MLSALVVEDEWLARALLVELIQASQMAQVIGAVGQFDEATSLLSDETALGTVDVVFVDVKLIGSKENGLDLVRKHSQQPGAPAFVLATASTSHAVEGFELGVVDYLHKPYNEVRVRRALERVLSKQVPRVGGPTRIVARKKRNLVFLHLDEIWAFESANGLSLVHSDRGVFDVDLSLDAAETSMARTFQRAHRNWLVSASHILELERGEGETALLVGSRAPGAQVIRVPVARERTAAIRASLIQASFGLRKR